MFSSSPVSLSAHKDVLEATVPEDSSQRAALLEELKRRGKGAVVAQRWPDAVALYTKSLQVAVTDGEKAILHANIALSHGKMGKWEDSHESCQEAVRLDPTYVKGWWRLGQAHTVQGNHKEAIAAFDKALQLEPGNKALWKEIEKAKIAEQKAKDAPPATTTKPKVEKAEPLKKVAPTKPAKEEETSAPVLLDDEAHFSASDHVKGYKVVNGKKTSYFHNELSEDAAKLIGDIAPKKLEGSVVEEPAPAPTNGVSAWNKAGTWEEKDCTKWAKESLEKSLLSTQAGEWHVTKADVGSGHASVAMVRGKKRYIYEMENVVLDWDFQGGDATGKIHVAGFDGTDAEYEFLEFEVTQSEEGELGKRLKRPSSQTALRDGIQQSIGAWVKLFQDTF